MKHWLNRVFLGVLLSISPSFQNDLLAQTSSEILGPELEKELNDLLSNGLNGLVIFSSTSALGSGSFELEQDDGSPDTELDVIRLMNDFYFEEQGSEPFIPYVRAGVGYLKLSEQVLPEGEGINDFSTVKTTSVVLGFGADFRLSEGLFLTPGFDIIYSHSENNYDFNNKFSQESLSVLDGDLFNWDVDTFSYNPQLALRYQFRIGRTAFIPSATYTHALLESFDTNSDIIDVSTSSGILNTKIRAEVPTSAAFGSGEVFIVPQISRTDVFADAEDGLGFGYFHEVSLGLLAKKQDIVPFLSEVGITAGYSFAEDLTGYRIGLEADF